MHARTSPLWRIYLLSWVFCVLLPDGPVAAEHARWEVTMAVRIEGGSRKNVRVRLALPGNGPGRRVGNFEVIPRGLTFQIHEGDEPYVVFTGRVRTARRVAITFVVDSAPVEEKLPAVAPIADPSSELLPFLSVAPNFQVRSILVREFLETRVGPVVRNGTVPLHEAIFDVTQRDLAWKRDGKSLTLDVIRAGGGKRIGIERAFTTFLRCARIPARLVEGLNLGSRTKKKRVFWTELWAQNGWWPMSASRGWVGRMPPSYVALARNGASVVDVDGPATASYTVLTKSLGDEVATIR